ncbi:c-type cytochrome [Stenotrophomonas pigmentata]|uniref:c-type cytochrome n=1 Tax=Stenotrophomonas pigmentata TaxID=3055080 RepID=UPI0026F109CB|nr:c-type cytochrome [Stenotrophomonas sp. 610A2]
MRSMLIIAALLLAVGCSEQSETAATTAQTTAPAASETKAIEEVAATAINGEQAFAMCTACHSRDASAPQRMGPNLHDLLGRKAGSSPGFDYSPALRASDITWNAQELDAYLAAPTKRVPGTRMAIAVTDPARRQALIEYLSAP